MTIDQHEHPLHNLAMDIRYDLTAAQGKLTELMRQIGELPVADYKPRESFMNGPVTAHTCDNCGVGNGQHATDCQAVHLEIERDHVRKAFAAKEDAV